MAIPEIAQAGKLLAETVQAIRAELANVKQTRASEQSLVRALALTDVALQCARIAWKHTQTYVTLADRAALQTAREMADRETRQEQGVRPGADQGNDPGQAEGTPRQDGGKGKRGKGASGGTAPAAPPERQ